MPASKYNLFSWYMPFYNQSICEIKSILAWIQCRAAITISVAVINDDVNDPSPIVAFYIGISMVIIASKLLLAMRTIWIR